MKIRWVWDVRILTKSEIKLSMSVHYLYILFYLLTICSWFPGGGPAVLTNYSPVEEAMLTLIEPVAITGLLGGL